MISHVSLGARNLQAAAKFYDLVMMALGAARVTTTKDSLGYGRDGAPTLWIGLADEAGGGAGCHVCFEAEDRQSVDAFHAAGLAAGGVSNGPPGLRPHYHPDYYAAFLIDPDGHHIEALTFSAT